MDWLGVWCFLSIIGQSEDGADQDGPEEGTPASPRTKRRVGRPGRKRKQLLPVSTVITGCRRPFILHTAAEWLIIHSPIQHPPVLVWKDMLNMHALLPGTLCLTFMHSHLLAAEWQHAVSSALWHKTHSTRHTALINCHIWVCLTDNVTKPLHSCFFCCFSSAFTCKIFSNQCV